MNGTVVAAVERKTLEDLAGSLLSGRLTYALAELAALPRAAVVVEERFSRLFSFPHAPGARVAEALAEAQARFPAVPVVFCETRPLAEEWTYRWLGACLAELAATNVAEWAAAQTSLPADTEPQSPEPPSAHRPSLAEPRRGRPGASDPPPSSER